MFHWRSLWNFQGFFFWLAVNHIFTISGLLWLRWQGDANSLLYWQNFSILFKAGCANDYECSDSEVCLQRSCVDPCLFDNPCGTNANCAASSHRAICSCFPNHKGNPYVKCDPYECLQDPDCPTDLKCELEKCVDPCRCAQNADCSPRNHRGICTCIPDFTGDPYGVACSPISKKHEIMQAQGYFF